MKYAFLIITLLSFSFLSAQSDSGRMHSKAEAHRNKMKQRLNLTPEQEAKMKAIHADRKAAIEKRHEENKLFRENLKNRTEAQIDEVLTPEQQAEREKIKEEHKQKMKEKHGDRPHPRGKGKWQGKGRHGRGVPADTSRR